MNLKRCANGHYYDADKYEECPRCGSREVSSIKTAKSQQVSPVQEQAAPQVQSSSWSKKWLTGWLACIEGDLAGMVYELKKGKNTIGGTDGQDINLGADAQVARACQAVVEYDPETRVFSASAGDSREMSYVNGQVVLFNLELHGRDILQVGGEKLMFIPLCGKDFAWEGTEEEP